MAAALIVSAVWGKAQSARAERFERLSDEYISYYTAACARCGRELSASVSQMETSLLKLRVTGSESNRILALEDIARESGEAAGLLSRLPQAHAAHTALAEFLARAGDYSRSLSKKLLSEGELSEADIDKLEEVLAASERLARELEERIANGDMPVGTESFDFYDTAEDDEPEPEYPELVCGGMYPAQGEPRLSGEDASPEEAKAEAERILGCSVQYSGKTEGVLPAYGFTSSDGSAEISLTVTGLHTVSVMRAPSGGGAGKPGEEELESLARIGAALLERAGYSGLVPIRAAYEEGAAVICCIPKQGETLILCDVVRVWIDMEAGEAIGLDAREYLMNSREREIPAPLLTAEEALAAVSSALEVSGARLVLAPLDSMTEALCYELRGSCRGNEYLVYINAMNGREERILRIVSDEYGERTL